MRLRCPVLIALAAAACGKGEDAAPQPAPAKPAPPMAAPANPVAPLGADQYADLSAALAAIIPQDARVLGFGELHQRTDRAQVRSTLARFTSEALPALQDRLSDLVVETWIVDPGCGSAAQEATAKVEITMRRPQQTKSEIGELADAARKAGVQPHAMHVTCDDYARIAPPGKEVQPEAMLTLTTHELGRIAAEAVTKPSGGSAHRPMIAVYGGALHNDRFPDQGVADWSYAKLLDDATAGHFVEIDLVVPELAAADPAAAKQPWFSLVTAADSTVHVWKRGERSFVVVLPKAA